MLIVLALNTPVVPGGRLVAERLIAPVRPNLGVSVSL
jgi:hypothetical protein